MFTLFLLLFLDLAMMMPQAMPQAMPAAAPAINTQQMASQQQAFINQQAQLLVSSPQRTNIYIYINYNDFLYHITALDLQ